MKRFKKAKHKNDYNHGKNGFQAGNVRYQRTKADKGRSMGKAAYSRF